ncbi:hypothetical protein K488DRAFT_88277 [Vararia minispora EC-137]|uniref:Uncharacterized protein n=1 Tax=Vararia minispora EC-137 TaxID=1314806 RepID=A0ACB8QE85_9AGAM|nr:hypothetical protein K488DRAFT_88277 [Vararia minispora EC-137]
MPELPGTNDVDIVESSPQPTGTLIRTGHYVPSTREIYLEARLAETESALKAVRDELTGMTMRFDSVRRNRDRLRAKVKRLVEENAWLDERVDEAGEDYLEAEDKVYEQQAEIMRLSERVLALENGERSL